MNKKKGLGKGLSALLSAVENETELQSDFQIGSKSSAPSYNVPLDSIDPNPNQPRTDFPDDSLAELCESIKSLGIIQPLTLRKKENGRYEIISGERRFRAAKMAGLTEVPSYVRSAGDTEVLEMALVENIQREDLNALDVAISLKRLVEEFNLTQEQLSQRLGKQRSTLANFIRLLKLPPEIQKGLREDKISMGHARALINVADAGKQIQIFRKIVEKGLSVRQVEEIVRNISKFELEKMTGGHIPHQNPEYYMEYLEKLTDFFGTNVEIRRTKKGEAKVTITFSSEADMVAFLDRMPNA